MCVSERCSKILNMVSETSDLTAVTGATCPIKVQLKYGKVEFMVEKTLFIHFIPHLILYWHTETIDYIQQDII